MLPRIVQNQLPGSASGGFIDQRGVSRKVDMSVSFLDTHLFYIELGS